MIIVETFKMNFLALQVDLPVGVETFNVDTPLHMSPKIYQRQRFCIYLRSLKLIA